MSEEKKRVPKLRFPGFEDEWEQRKLGEVFKERSERAKGEEELLSVTISNGVIRQVDSDKRDIASEDKSNYKIVRKGDVPYNSMRMWQGAVGNSEYDGIVSPAYTVLVPTDEANGKFFMELFKRESSLQIFQRWSQGLTSDTWNLKYPALSSIQFYLPSVEEQTKIAEYFQTIDHLITLHQRKLEHLKQVQKGLLQKMFPKEGEKIPEIRFPGFKDEWEQRKLGEIGTIQTCKRIFKEQTSEVGDIPFYKNGTIGLKADAFISREIFEEYKELYPYPEVGDILISAVGSIGRTAEYTGKDEYFQDSNVVWLKTDDKINKKFLKVSYQVIKWLIEGSTVKHLYNDNILKSEIIVPKSQKEQRKIGAYFENLDHLITLHQRKLEHLQQLKKGLLQQMFI